MEIELSPRAERQLRKLRNMELLGKFDQAFEEITSRPFTGKLLEGRFSGVRSYRVGAWRILYEIYAEEQIILVQSIADRKEVYRG